MEMLIQMNGGQRRKAFLFTIGWSATLESPSLLTNHYRDILGKDFTTTNQQAGEGLLWTNRVLLGVKIEERNHTWGIHAC